MLHEAINVHSFDSYILTDKDYQRAIGDIQTTFLFSEGTGRLKEKTTVFISHKHSDLTAGRLSKFLGCLIKDYNVDPYIDSFDKEMPEKISGKTADRIKSKITNCSKFILFASILIFLRDGISFSRITERARCQGTVRWMLCIRAALDKSTTERPFCLSGSLCATAPASRRGVGLINNQ